MKKMKKNEKNERKVLKNEKTYVIMKPDITQKLNVEIKLNQYRSNLIFEP